MGNSVLLSLVESLIYFHIKPKPYKLLFFVVEVGFLHIKPFGVRGV